MSKLTPEQIKSNDEFFSMGEAETKLQDYMLQEHGIPMVESELQSLLHEVGFYRLRQENERLREVLVWISSKNTTVATIPKNPSYPTFEMEYNAIVYKAKEALNEQN